MKFATFMTEMKAGRTVEIPSQVCERLRLSSGDRLEISLKRIKSRRIDLLLSENPLYRLLDLSAGGEGDSGK